MGLNLKDPNTGKMYSSDPATSLKLTDPNSGFIYSNTPVVQNNPTPYVTNNTPQVDMNNLNDTQQKVFNGVKTLVDKLRNIGQPEVKQESFNTTENPDLVTKYGTYNNYRSDTVSDEYVAGANDRARNIIQDSKGGTFGERLGSVWNAFKELRNTGLATSESERAAQYGMTVPEWKTYQDRKYELEDTKRAATDEKNRVLAAESTLKRIQDQINTVNATNYGAGNINLSQTPRFENEDGTYSYMPTVSFRDAESGLVLLVPATVQVGKNQWKPLTEAEAIAQYRSTGKYLGAFHTDEEAQAYANELTNQQAQLYGRNSELSAQYQAAAEMYKSMADKYNTGVLKNWQDQSERFNYDYNPTAYYMDQLGDNRTLANIDNVIAGLDAQLEDMDAGTDEYNTTKRRRDELYENRFLFATDEELRNAYGKKDSTGYSDWLKEHPEAENLVEGPYKYTVAHAMYGADTMNTEWARAGREIARRDAVRIAEEVEGSWKKGSDDARKYLDALAAYSVSGDLKKVAKDYLGLEEMYVDRTNYSIKNIEEEARNALKKLGYSRKEINNVIEFLAESGDALAEEQRTQALNDKIAAAGTGAKGAAVEAAYWTAARLMNMVAGIPAMYGAAEKLFSGSTLRTINPNDPNFKGINTVRAIDTAIQNKYDDKVNIPVMGEVDLFDVAYGIVTSSVDSMLAAGVSSALGSANIGGAMIGVSAGTQAMLESARNGDPVGASIVTGIAAGVFEGLFEKVSIGQFQALQEAEVGAKNIFEALTVKEFRREIEKNIAKSFVTNFEEEFATELANVSFDLLRTYLTANNTNYRTAIAQYMTQINPDTGGTYTPEEAKKRVAIDLALQIGEAGLTGGIQGILMGGVSQFKAISNINQVEKEVRRSLKPAEKNLIAQLNIGITMNPNSRSYQESVAAVRESIAIDQMTDRAEQSAARKAWFDKYQNRAYTLADLIASEWADYAPNGETKAMRNYVLDAIQRGDSTPFHVESEIETKIRETQAAIGMDEHTANDTRRIILDVLNGRDGSEEAGSIRYGRVSAEVLTSDEFRDLVQQVFGSRPTGKTASAVKAELNHLASLIANEHLIVTPPAETKTAQDNLVQPTAEPTAPVAENPLFRNTYQTNRAVTKARGDVLQNAVDRTLGYNGTVSADYTTGAAADQGTASENGYTMTPEGYSAPMVTAAAADVADKASGPMESRTEAAQTRKQDQKTEPQQQGKFNRFVDKLTGRKAMSEEPSLEIVNRAVEEEQPSLTVDDEQITEEEFIRAAVEDGKYTEEQARAEYRRLTENGGKSKPGSTAQSIAQNVAEEKKGERAAEEQDITFYQWLYQQAMNQLTPNDKVQMEFVPSSKLPGLNAMNDLGTGKTYVGANAPDYNTNTVSGIETALGHEWTHTVDEQRRKEGKAPFADLLLGYYDKDTGAFNPGLMQRLTAVGALKGKYAEMANDPEKLQDYIGSIMAQYKDYYKNKYKDWTQDDIDKLVTIAYIREEIAGDLWSNLIGRNTHQYELGLTGTPLYRSSLLNILAGMDDEPIRAAELSLRERLELQKQSGLKGRKFRQAYDTVQSEMRALLADFQDALKNYEPNTVNGVRESIASLSYSMGIDAERNPDTHEISYKINGQYVDHVTKDHVKNHSGVGVMIRLAEENKTISPEEANRQYQAMADLMNNIMKTQDPELYWNWAGATIFSAIRSNSDPQYSTTVDFSTVCRKTQDMLTAVSAAMMERAKQNPDGYGGLTKDEITNLQAKVNEANLPVPCPVCYVFSRWAGAGGILDNINRLQRKFGSMSQEEMTAQRNNLEQQMIDRGLAKKNKKGGYQFSRDNIDALVKEKSATVDKLEGEQAKLESLAQLGQETDETRNRLEAIAADLQQLKSDLDLLGEWQWVKNVATDPNYKPVPDYVLYNLDDGETFARDYNVVWGWRTTRGSGAGKAILPYSDMRLGDFFVGAKKGSSADESNSDTDAVLFDNSNAFTSAAYGQDKLNKDQKNLAASAQKRVNAQNLIGGQRLQSTSDFRYEYALDYLQTFLEMQALGSKAQTYTKVREFVDIICSVGGDCNMSVMPKGKGYENGRLVFSNVTGMDIKAALDANRRFDNAQLILVGINDTHIELALEDSEETGGIDIGFVIPYHTSGAKIEGFISELVQNLGERINTKRDYWDYTKLQSDSVVKEQRMGADGKLHWEDARTDAQIALTALRKHLLTERDGNRKWRPTAAEKQEIYDALARGNNDILGRSFDDLRDVELKALAGDPKAIAEYKSWTQANVAKLFQRLWESDGQDYGTRLNSAQAEHIMPYEYWDTRTTRDNAYINGFLFRSYCYNLGLRPRFTGWSSDGGRMTKTFTDDNGAETTQEYGDFSNSTGYWKTLIDRPMYDNNGDYREQQSINLTDFNQDMLNKDYAQNFPETYRARENDFEKATQVGRTWSQNNQWREGVGTKEALEGMSAERARNERMSIAQADADGRELSEGQQAYFKDSVVRDEDGLLKPMYHGTSNAGFTVFDPYYSKFGLFGNGFYFTDNPEVAESYTKKGKGTNRGVYQVYLNAKNLIDMDAAADLSKWEQTFRAMDVDLDYLRGAKTNEDVFRALKDYAQDMEMYKWEGEEFMQDVLREAGYDGITHQGGGRYGAKDGPRHQVVIVFDQDQIKNTDNLNPTHNPDIRYSLAAVDPVESKGGWKRGATFDEVKEKHPTLFELDADEADKRNPTQITGTVKTYRKIYDILKREGFNGTILDASSGLGVGTEAGRNEYGFDVDDIEPFPDPSYNPRYTDYSTLDKQYDAIISNAVLNVIPQDLRDAMVVKIGELLAPGGRAFINVRGADVKNASSKVAIDEDGMEYFISDSGSYQKGFRKPELKAYLEDALGDGFTVELTNQFGGVAAIVTKNGGSENQRYSIAHIIGDDGTDYGDGVYLDSPLYNGLTDNQRKGMLALRVSELGEQGGFIAYDNNGNPVNIIIAKDGRTFKNEKGRSVDVNHDLAVKNNGVKIRQETIALADELIQTAKNPTSRPKMIHTHDWLDNNGLTPFTQWTTYAIDSDNNIWEVPLYVANATTGEKILYDLGYINNKGTGTRWPKSPNTGAAPMPVPSNGNSTINAAQSQAPSLQRNSISQNPQQMTREQRIKDIVDRVMANANFDDHTQWYDAARSDERMPISKTQVNDTTGYRADRDAYNLPAQDDSRRVIMRAAQTIANSGLTDEKMARTIEQAASEGMFKYIRHTDANARKAAETKTSQLGWDGAYGEYKDAVDRGLTSKDTTALGIQLYDEAIQNEDYYGALDVASLMIKNSHEAASALQAMKMLSGLDSNGQLYMMMKGINNITDAYKKLYPKVKLQIDDAMVKAYQKALMGGDKEAADKALHEIESSIAEQVSTKNLPFATRWKERLNNWRYFAMLANPVTHFRNMGGNLGFAPVRLMKQAIKAGLETVTMGAKGQDSHRTTALLNVLSQEDRARFKAGLADAKNVMDLIQSGGKQTGPKDRIEEMRQIAVTKALDKVMKANTKALDFEDVLFSAPAYAEALASFLKARGISAADFANDKISTELKAEAQAHAVKEAQRATYRDHNMFSDAIANIGKRGRAADASPIEKLGSTAIEAALPFKRTPANIMARAFEYSPAEILNIVFSDISKLTKAGDALRQAQEDSDGSLDALDAISKAEADVAAAKTNMLDHIASSVSGSLILLLGMLFRHKGWITGGEDDDEEQAAFDKLQGSQEYAIVDKKGNTYTMDWLAPEALPFFTGVAVYDKLIDRAEGEGNLYDDIKNVALGLYEPMLNMSMLQSINDLISDQKYVKETEQIPYFFKSLASSLASQFVPTALGKIENITETKRNSTYLDRRSKIGKDEQYFIANVMNKVPGKNAEYNQITNYDAWGREQSTGNLLQRVVQNMISPGYYKANSSTPYDEELQRLYDLGYTGVFPGKAKQSQSIDASYYKKEGKPEEQWMTASEYELYTKTQGEEQYKHIGELLNSKAYKAMDDEEKADAIKKVYSEAKQTALNAVLDARGESERAKATGAEKAGMSTTSYVAANSTFTNAETPEGFKPTKSGDPPEWAQMLAVLNDNNLTKNDRLSFVNAKSGRDEEFESYNAALEYYENSKAKAADSIKYEAPSKVYNNAKTPEGYKTTESGNTPNWAKMLAVIDDKTISDSLKLEYINKIAGLKEPFKSISEARKHYEEQKKKAKK